jgi:hypothetical protein
MSFTLDYGMRCGSLCELRYQVSLVENVIESTPFFAEGFHQAGFGIVRSLQ